MSEWPRLHARSSRETRRRQGEQTRIHGGSCSVHTCTLPKRRRVGTFAFAGVCGVAGLDAREEEEEEEVEKEEEEEEKEEEEEDEEDEEKPNE